MAASREAVITKYGEALRSSSIIGYGVDDALGNTIFLEYQGKETPCADVRLWEGFDGISTDETVCVEFLFADVPDALERSNIGELCATVVNKHLKKRCVEELHQKGQEFERNQQLRKRGGGNSDNPESGSVQAEALNERVIRSKQADPNVRIHTVEDIGGRGRRVVAVRTSMSVEAGQEMGILGYPSIFIEKSADQLAYEHWQWSVGLNCAFALLFLLVFLWLWFLYEGIWGKGAAARRKRVPMGEL